MSLTAATPPPLRWEETDAISHPLTPAADAGVATRTGSDEPSLLLCNYKHDPLLPGNNTSALVHTAKCPPRAQRALHSSKSFFHTDYCSLCKAGPFNEEKLEHEGNTPHLLQHTYHHLQPRAPRHWVHPSSSPRQTGLQGMRGNSPAQKASPLSLTPCLTISFQWLLRPWTGTLHKVRLQLHWISKSNSEKQKQSCFGGLSNVSPDGLIAGCKVALFNL